MARLDPDSPWLQLELPSFERTPFVEGPPLTQRCVAIISTAGLHRRDDPPFLPGAEDYRTLPREVGGGDIVMSHVSVNFDRTGFAQDINVVYPIERLEALAEDGGIGSVAENHYSFMGATEPTQMAETARSLAGALKQDRVDAAILAPV